MVPRLEGGKSDCGHAPPPTNHVRRALVVSLTVCGALATHAAQGQTAPPQALAEISYLQSTFGVPVNGYQPTPGDYSLAANQSFSAAQLAGKQLQSIPPQLGNLPTYPASQTDGTANPPYVSSGLQNFGFTYFNNHIYIHGGYTWHTMDYAAVHGFNAVIDGGRDSVAGAKAVMPAGTRWLGGLNSVFNVTKPEYLVRLGLDASRWDELVDYTEQRLVQKILNDGTFGGFLDVSGVPTVDELWIDTEPPDPALDPPTLRQQSWYPSSGTPAEQAAFEKKYYDGYALSLYAMVDAARQLNLTNISIYGWQPLPVSFYGLGTYPADPATDWFWQNVGIQVMQHVDSVNNSVYSFQPDIHNVAFTLAQNDLTLKYVNSLPAGQQKPVRPFFTNQLWGGNAGANWWNNLPMLSEELRAVTLLNFFTQFDGMYLWNNTYQAAPDGTDLNDNIPPAVVNGAFLMLNDGTFSAVEEGVGTHTFARYDVINVDSVDSSGNVRFQLVNQAWLPDPKLGSNSPYYDSTVTALSPHLRAASEPLAAMFEGLGMAKLLEWNLRNGTQVVDFDSQLTFQNTLPIVRHIKNGDLHIVATYDPQVVYGSPARNVTVNNFNGVTGLNLTFAADSQVRIYLVRLTPAATPAPNLPAIESAIQILLLSN
jgi:hypothetical protein